METKGHAVARIKHTTQKSLQFTVDWTPYKIFCLDVNRDHAAIPKGWLQGHIVALPLGLWSQEVVSVVPELKLVCAFPQQR